jgi:hypothetical protein
MKQNRNAGEADIFAGLIRIHVLHHACCDDGVFGLGMINELQRHGYRIGSGTMYPLLHGMERRGWLKSNEMRIDGRRRKMYYATRSGRKTLKKACMKVRELSQEIL